MTETYDDDAAIDGEQQLETAVQKQPAYNPEIERRAREMGWSTRDRWRGNPDEWVDAAEFVRRADNVLPIIRSHLNKSQEEVKRLKQELEARNKEVERRFSDVSSETERRIKALEAMNKQALELQRETLLKEFGDRKRNAAANGDMAAYDAASVQEAEMLRNIDAAVKATVDSDVRPAARREPRQERQTTQTQAAPVEEVPEEVKRWARNNPWFHADPELRQEASELHEQLLRDDPYLTIEENLAEVTREIRDRHPDKFRRQRQTETTPSQQLQQAATQAQTEVEPQPQRQPAQQRQRPTHTAVESTTNTRGTPKPRGEKGWKELPSEAKAQCDDIFTRLYKNKADEKKLEEFKTRYAKEYWAEYHSE